jgi:hypothetical protein
MGSARISEVIKRMNSRRAKSDYSEKAADAALARDPSNL